MINRFDKPHRVLPTYDNKKGLELFSMVARLDTHELLQHSLVNSIPLDVVNDMDENLIHEVVSIDPRKATDLNKLSVIKFLVTNGCNPDKPNKYNITPLHIACKQQLEEVVGYLLEIGCNPNYKDNMGLTPFHYLLTGNIKTINNMNDVMDFVPPPKNVDVDHMKKLVAIKQDLWTLIEPIANAETGLPILKTIENTITDIMTEDKIIIAKKGDIMSKLTPLISNSSFVSNDSIQSSILSSMKDIEKVIKNKFGGFKPIEISIHPSEDASWSPLGDTDKLSLIRNGKIKKVIKMDLKQLSKEIDSMVDGFIPLQDSSILMGGSLSYNQNENDDIIISTLNIFNEIIDEYNPKLLQPVAAPVAGVLTPTQQSIDTVFTKLNKLPLSEHINKEEQDVEAAFDKGYKGGPAPANQQNKYRCLNNIFTLLKNIQPCVDMAINNVIEPLVNDILAYSKYIIEDIVNISNTAGAIAVVYNGGENVGDAITLAFNSFPGLPAVPAAIVNAAGAAAAAIAVGVNAIPLYVLPPAINNKKNDDSIEVMETLMTYYYSLQKYWDANKIVNRVYNEMVNSLPSANGGPVLATLVTEILTLTDAELLPIINKLSSLKYIPSEQIGGDRETLDRAKKQSEDENTYNTIKYIILILINMIKASNMIQTDFNNASAPINDMIKMIKILYSDYIPFHRDSKGYLVNLIKRISTTQQDIKDNATSLNRGIGKLLNSGDSSNLSRVYTLWYPVIVHKSKFVSFYRELYTNLPKKWDTSTKKANEKLIVKQINQLNYKDLADKLNKINSNYYLYYYLFSKEKLLKLSRFNYYQLEIENPDNIVYYNAANQLAKIEEDDMKDAKENNLSENTVNQTVEDTTVKLFFVNIKPIQWGGKVDANEFKILKTAKIPPSLNNALPTFYEYAMKMLVKDIITNYFISSNPTAVGILDRVNKLRENSGFVVNDDILSSYEAIANLIRELMEEQINVYIYKKVADIYGTDISGKIIANIPKEIIGRIFPIPINIGKTNVTLLQKIKTKDGIVNLYPLMARLDKPTEFILYPNDFTNLSRLRSKYGIEQIREKIIKLLLQYGGSPYNTNSEGRSPIYPIILNHNHSIIKTLSGPYEIDFNKFANEKPRHFLIDQIKNNIHKISGGGNLLNSKMKDIFSNMNSYLYKDVTSTIQSNESFGNNIIVHLQTSFHLSTYLTLQFLSEHLLDINKEFTKADMDLILGLNKGFSESNMTTNYLLKNIPINDSKDNIIATKLINELNTEKVKKEQERDYINTGTTTIRDKAGRLKELNDYIIKLIASILILSGIGKSSGQSITQYNCGNTNNKEHLIDNYNNNIDNIVMLEAWTKLFNKPSKDNYNLIPLELLKLQSDYLESDNMVELAKINKAFAHFSRLAENYFDTEKYTDSNRFLRFINDMLVYNCKLVFGTSIEYMMRRILFTYFNQSMDDIANITRIIDIIIESEYTGKTLIDRLYCDVCPELVRTSAEIFKSRADEQGRMPIPVRDILLNFFKLLEISPIKLDPIIIEVFKKNVIPYLDSFISKSILLWYVNVENILKFHINNYRATQSLIELK